MATTAGTWAFPQASPWCRQVAGPPWRAGQGDRRPELLELLRERHSPTISCAPCIVCLRGNN